MVKPCARCAITTVDQRTGITSKEPLRTLATFRKHGTKVLFGQNLIHDETVRTWVRPGGSRRRGRDDALTARRGEKATQFVD